MSGRRPIPTALKILRGNPGKRRLHAGELRPQQGMPRCPDHLLPEARAEWRRMSRQLCALGILTLIDRAALAMYCQAWARWVEAEAHVKKHGLVIRAPVTGFPIQNPFLAVSNKAQEQMRSLLIEFGMTPASRTRIDVTRAGSPSPEVLEAETEWEELRRGIVGLRA